MSEPMVAPETPERLQCRYRLSRGIAVIDVRGEVDVSTCGLLRDRLLLALTDRGRNNIVVNLADVSFIDSTGLGVLVRVWHRAQAGQGILALAAPSPQARAVFGATGLLKVLSIYETEAQAVEACRQAQAATPGGR
jgi:anti-sigma B factor antagonist